MFRFKPLPPVDPFEAGGDCVADPLDRDVVTLVVDTIGATTGFGEAGGDAEDEVTDGILGSETTCTGDADGGGDFGGGGVTVTVDTPETSLMGSTSPVVNEAVLTNVLLE